MNSMMPRMRRSSSRMSLVMSMNGWVMMGKMLRRRMKSRRRRKFYSGANAVNEEDHEKEEEEEEGLFKADAVNWRRKERSERGGPQARPRRRKRGLIEKK